MGTVALLIIQPTGCPQSAFLVLQQQPLLHQSTISPKGKEQAEEEGPQDGPSANGNEAGSSSEANAESSSKADHWNAVVAAEVNEPVGIITIEDVLEELIGQVCMGAWCAACAVSLSARVLWAIQPLFVMQDIIILPVFARGCCLFSGVNGLLLLRSACSCRKSWMRQISL